jgi:hypothetical protein
MTTTTDTPRTDAETYVWQHGRENPFVHKDFARQLERELNASQAEVAKLGAEVLMLKKQVAALRSEKNACLDGNVYYGNKIGILNDRINRVLDILTERIK